MNEEFKFRPSGTSILLSFAELDKRMQEQLVEERDRIEHKLTNLVTRGVIEIGDFDQVMQEQYQKEINHIENQLIEVFDRRLKGKTDSIGRMKEKDIIRKFQ